MPHPSWKISAGFGILETTVVDVRGGLRMKEDYKPVFDNRYCEDMLKGTYHGVLVMCADNRPYAVPMNHGYAHGRFYFHCAKEGRKLEIIRENPSVSYVVKNYYGAEEDFQDSMRCHGQWESVIAYGKAHVVEEHGSLKEAFKRFMAYYNKPDYEATEKVCETTGAIIVNVDEMTARRETADGKTEFYIWKPVNA
jgi:nitroimidazol reductase NimA-like FMN-containing flavoprotein (pyridoxamine 5'-phosphate oxidase superfamily)